jgi:folylpolyglutamate synthase/dihydropteroate synthase
LGNTVEKIAKTKVRIIKTWGPADSYPHASAPSNYEGLPSAGSVRAVGSPSSGVTPRLVVVSGVKQPSVIEIVEERCKEVGAKLYRLGKDFKLTTLPVALLGDYQKENASLAIKVILEFEKLGFKISENAIRKGLKTAFFPGRFEVIQLARQPRVSDDARLHVSKKQLLNSASLSKSQLQSKSKLTFSSSESGLSRSINSHLSSLISHLVLDGAHNPTKMKEFLKSLKKIFPRQKKIFVVGFKFDKDIAKMLKQIVKVADKIIVTEFKAKTDVAVHASAEALRIKDELLRMKYRGTITVEKDSGKALKKAIKMKPELIVVTGSLYLAGEVRGALTTK